MSLANWSFPHDPRVCVCVPMQSQIASTVELCQRARWSLTDMSPFSSAFRDLSWFRGISTPRTSKQLPHFRFCNSGVPLVSGSHAPVLLEAAELASFLFSANALLLTPPMLCQASVLWAQLSPSFPKLDLILYLIFLVALGNSQREKGKMPTLPHQP